MSDTQELMKVREAAAALTISRATLYRLPFFRQRMIEVSPGRVAIRRADVELYQILKTKGRAA